ncbi:MAG TPA: DegT/DnrJ/EryC1/StrS family aminotransferase, partial [Phycisphaerae bacterium]|nr:DegT/DnrJ/EryC1/StrS family aminotransferase [Phycisphaerae bacterium]
MSASEKLAIDGGTPAVPANSMGRRLIGPQERQAVLDLLDRAIAEGKAFDRYGGQEVDAYEKAFAAWLGLKYATAVSSGTAAVHTALAALHLEPGTEVICSPITDPGAVMPVVCSLCVPVFADTSPESFNCDPESIEQAVTDHTGAIVLGHIAGEPCQVARIAEIARRRGIPLIEDCAQAHGATYDGRPVGTFGTMAAFSLMSGKHQTSGGQGGMVLTNDEGLYWDAKRFADRGKPFNSDQATNLFMGLNYRMTELEAAIGRVQLRRLPELLARRQRLADRLAGHLADSKVFTMGWMPAAARSAYWFLRIRVRTERLDVDKSQVAAALSAEGVGAAPTYTSLIHVQKWFAERRTFGSAGLPWSLPGARRIDYVD